ncbi:MAG: hypothetical protein QOI73_603 [Solirubrobacteraceae bacterium]|nr:hypothetical protein [Solirubrobacteraceae bacterium]
MYRLYPYRAVGTPGLMKSSRSSKAAQSLGPASSLSVSARSPAATGRGRTASTRHGLDRSAV